MKTAKNILEKIIKEEVVKILKEKYTYTADMPPVQANSIRIDELTRDLLDARAQIDDLYSLLNEHVLKPKGIAIPRSFN